MIFLSWFWQTFFIISKENLYRIIAFWLLWTTRIASGLFYNLNDLKDFAEPYIDEENKEKIIRKTYPLQKEFLRILGRNAEIYNSLGDGMFYLNIYIKDLKTNKIFVINRNKIFIDFESAGPKVFIPNI